MSVALFTGFPRQMLSYKQKGAKWGKQCVDFADNKGTFMHVSAVQKSVLHKRINYDLVNMKVHKDDIAYVLNPNNQKASYIPDTIQHYPGKLVDVVDYINDFCNNILDESYDSFYIHQKVWNLICRIWNNHTNIRRHKNFYTTCYQL
jgi:hypothetical protein